MLSNIFFATAAIAATAVNAGAYHRLLNIGEATNQAIDDTTDLTAAYDIYWLKVTSETSDNWYNILHTVPEEDSELFVYSLQYALFYVTHDEDDAFIMFKTDEMINCVGIVDQLNDDQNVVSIVEELNALTNVAAMTKCSSKGESFQTVGGLVGGFQQFKTTSSEGFCLQWNAAGHITREACAAETDANYSAQLFYLQDLASLDE